MVDAAHEAAAIANQNAETAYAWKSHAEKLEVKLTSANEQLNAASAECKRLEEGWWEEYARRHALEGVIDLLLKARSDPNSHRVEDWMLDPESRRKAIDAHLSKVIETLKSQRQSREEYDAACFRQAIEEYKSWEGGYAAFGVSKEQHEDNVKAYMQRRLQQEVREFGRELTLDERVALHEKRLKEFGVLELEFFRKGASPKIQSKWFGMNPLERRRAVEEWKAKQA